MGRRAIVHDELIRELLVQGRLVVLEDDCDLVADRFGDLKPRTKIYLRDIRSGVLREKVIRPNVDGHPYLIFTRREEGRRTPRAIWLPVRRVVWYAFNRERTSALISPIDKDRTNYNIWNLRPVSQNDQNYERKAFPKDHPNAPSVDSGTPAKIDGSDLPF